jgi:hypothetical protein
MKDQARAEINIYVGSSRTQRMMLSGLASTYKTRPIKVKPPPEKQGANRHTR